MTVIEPPQEPVRKPRRERRKVIARKGWKEPPESRQCLSRDETEFIRRLKEEFQLADEDLSLFYLVGYARHASRQGLPRETGPDRVDIPPLDFTPASLTLLMECIGPSKSASRGYFAAMVYLKHHAPPEPPDLA